MCFYTDCINEEIKGHLFSVRGEMERNSGFVDRNLPLRFTVHCDRPLFLELKAQLITHLGGD